MRHFLLSLIIPINIFLQLADFYNKKFSKKLHQNKHFKIFYLWFHMADPSPSFLCHLCFLKFGYNLLPMTATKRKHVFPSCVIQFLNHGIVLSKSVENKVSWFHFEALGFIKSNISLKEMGLVLVSLRPMTFWFRNNHVLSFLV